MQSTTKKRGRPQLNDSETLLRTFKISERDYQSFLAWCKERDLKPTSVVRSLVIRFTVEGLLEETQIRSLEELKKERK